MPRLFTAIHIPTECQAVLSDIQPLAQDGVSLTPADEMHVTLHFIGEVSELTCDAIRLHLRSVQAECFNLQLDGVGYFGEKENPHVLWSGTNLSAELVRLRDAIGEVLTKFEIKLEERAYSPHVTLARLNKKPEIVEMFLHSHKEFSTRIEASCFTLYLVERAGRKFGYRKLEEYKLDS